MALALSTNFSIVYPPVVCPEAESQEIVSMII